MADPPKIAVDAEALGRKIRAALYQTGETPKWLAVKSGIGVSTVYSILNGHQLPSLEKLRQLCSVLNLSIDWLLDIESDSFYLRPQIGHESRSYADLEEFWLSQGSGERLSLSRGFSIVHQPLSLREQVLKRIYELPQEQADVAMEAFVHRRRVIDEHERRRVEVVVQSEVEDFVLRRPPWDRLDAEPIKEFIETIISRLREDLLGFEVVLIPRQLFVVNYEILNREIIVFDLGQVFMRQSHQNLLDHFMRQVSECQKHPESIVERSEVIQFLEQTLQRAGAFDDSSPQPASQSPD
ncbi:helix-turn-helix protein [Pseudobythopirellula maris]|uniref:Helix-turn-helix protein n=1 Tax=Pseudobythopirellula maris TaxID=2527991 RepID=A0A5C5ZRY9_9BACT|nr:helix-turn-helix transcriptional regulator [Pseudobythopirellula maris]TWT90302.1 helix-turn-helix protein [Pseudobythopirellula maris]